MSRRLLLLRHAKSSWADPSLGDRDRPLNARGREAAARMGAWIAEEDLAPDVALVSDAARTVETWERLNLPGDTEVRLLDALYGASPREQLALIQGLADDVRKAMLIGHNPSIGALAQGLSGGRLEVPVMSRFLKFPTAGLAVYDIEVDSWRALAPEHARLVKFLDPRSL